MALHLREKLLLAGLKLAHRFDRRHPDPAELGTPAIRRILVVSCTAIGDTIMSTPALVSLRRAYPQARIVLMVNPPYRSLFENNPDIDGLLGYGGRWSGWIAAIRQARAERFDLVAILHGNEPQATPLAYLSGARWRFKLPNANDFRFLLSNAEPVVAWRDLGHGIDQRLAVARLAGGAPVAPTLVLPIAAPAREQLARRLAERWGIGGQDTVLGFQVGASTASRRWRPERYAELARDLLAAYPDLKIVVTGSPAEKALADAVAQQVASARLIVTAGEVPMAEMPALIARFAGLVTPDTGIMHMAIAVGTPVVALFAAADPATSGPLQELERHIVIRKWRTCDPCLGKRCPYPAPLCMDNIHVAEVEAACRRLLGEERKA